MDFDQLIWNFFAEYAYKPYLVYGGIVTFMTLSSFGLPLPEEVVLVCAGIVAFMALNPTEFPPPTPGAEGVDLFVLAIVCLASVILSDFFIYMIGRLLGEKILKSKMFKKQAAQKRLS